MHCAEPMCAVIVAHPDDETLWCGGHILEHRDRRWFVASLCRASDADRAPRFRQALEELGATGRMADVDDGPEQVVLSPGDVQAAVASLLPRCRYEVILTHGPFGEYTRHRRHEECCRAVVSLWQSGVLDARALWLFAYEDGGRAYLPKVRDDADYRVMLSEATWRKKRDIITTCYGFAPHSWEAEVAPREEGFWCFHSPSAASARVSACEVDG